MTPTLHLPEEHAFISFYPGFSLNLQSLLWFPCYSILVASLGAGEHPCTNLFDSELFKLGVFHTLASKRKPLNCWPSLGFAHLKCVMWLLLCPSYLTSSRNSDSFCAISKGPGNHYCNVGSFPFTYASFLTLQVWEWPLNHGEISVLNHLCLKEYFHLSNRIKFVPFSKRNSKLNKLLQKLNFC